jgi:hypothetical protein
LDSSRTSGKDERGLDRVENLAAVKRAITRVGPAAVNVGDGFPGARLRGDSGGELIAGAVDRDDLDLRVVFFEFVEQRRLSVPADIEIQPRLFLGRRHGLLPVAAPVGAQVRRQKND